MTLYFKYLLGLDKYGKRVLFLDFFLLANTLANIFPFFPDNNLQVIPRDRIWPLVNFLL